MKNKPLIIIAEKYESVHFQENIPVFHVFPLFHVISCISRQPGAAAFRLRALLRLGCGRCRVLAAGVFCVLAAGLSEFWLRALLSSGCGRYCVRSAYVLHIIWAFYVILNLY
jgi:hypothetical protein